AVRDRLEELLDEGERELRRDEEHLAVERDFPGEIGPPGEIHDDPRQRFIERNVRVPEPADAALVPQRLPPRLAEREAGVLDGVVKVDVDVSRRLDGEAEAGVAGDRVEHVVEESHGSVDPGCGPPRRTELDADGGLLRGALHQAHVYEVTSLHASRNRSFSPGFPTV